MWWSCEKKRPHLNLQMQLAAMHFIDHVWISDWTPSPGPDLIFLSNFWPSVINTYYYWFIHNQPVSTIVYLKENHIVKVTVFIYANYGVLFRWQTFNHEEKTKQSFRIMLITCLFFFKRKIMSKSLMEINSQCLV